MIKKINTGNILIEDDNVGRLITEKFTGRIEKIIIKYGNHESPESVLIIKTEDGEEIVSIEGCEDGIWYPRNWDVQNQKYIGVNMAADGQNTMNAERWLVFGKLIIEFKASMKKDFIKDIIIIYAAEQDEEKEIFIENDSIDKEMTAEDETDIIDDNKRLLENRKTHKFKPAKWTHPNGHPRCILCGQEERTGGMCDQLPIKKEDSGVTSSTPGVFNPTHGKINRRRRGYLREFIKKEMVDITKSQKQKNLLLNKVDDLRLFVQESLFTRKFEGISKKDSDSIKEFLLRAISKGFDKERIIRYIEGKGVNKNQANLIFQQETHELRNKTREWVFDQLPGEQIVKWIGPGDSRRTTTCQRITARTQEGVTVERLKEIIQEETNNAIARGELPANYEARDYTPHFRCRHVMVKKF